MRSEIEQRRSALADDMEAIEDRVRPSRVAKRRTEGMRTKVRSAREAVMGRVEDQAGSARDMAGSAREMAGAVTDAPHQLTQTARGNPIAAGVVAFGLGLLTAALIPPTDTERELAENMAPQIQQAREAITEAVSDDARAIADQVSPKVQEDLGQLQESVKGSASRVQDEVRG